VSESEEKLWREGDTMVKPMNLPKQVRSDVATAFLVVLVLNFVWAAAIVAIVFATR